MHTLYSDSLKSDALKFLKLQKIRTDLLIDCYVKNNQQFKELRYEKRSTVFSAVNNHSCYIAEIFSLTARALVGYFEVT